MKSILPLPAGRDSVFGVLDRGQRPLQSDIDDPGRHADRTRSARFLSKIRWTANQFYNALQLNRACPLVGQTVPKQPLWDTFQPEKPKVFSAFSGVQIPWGHQFRVDSALT